MGTVSEIIEEPLTAEALAERYRELCRDPRYADLHGKLEMDLWGRITMSPASNLHSMLQTRLAQRLLPLGGQAFVEASVLTKLGLTVADVAWASEEFMRLHGIETPFTSAPDLCVEIASPTNSRKELLDNTAAYLAAGAREAWIVFPQSQRFEVHGPEGLLSRSSLAIDLDAFF